MKYQNKVIINDKIKNNSDLLNEISQKIWQNPELKFEEVKAHDLLCDVLEKQEFKVQRNYILPTAFRAEYNGKKPGPTIAVLCEYDALPEIGHACGHNLIAEAGLGAGIAIKAALEADHSLPGRVVVMGTPAEEDGGGKIILINGGAFKDIDIALMVHPGPIYANYLSPATLACQQLEVIYTGKEAHASGFPWEGINALDAAVACYNNISHMRQQMKPNWRVHCVITNGGTVPNIIPGLSKLKMYFRAPTTKDMLLLRKQVEGCVNGAAQSTGCQVNLEYDKNPYANLITNKILIELYQKYSEEIGIKFEDIKSQQSLLASTDMGNVSHILPSIHPMIAINTKAGNHTKEFSEAAGKQEAQNPILIAAEAMALLAVEVMENPKILEKAKLLLEEDIANDAK